MNRSLNSVPHIRDFGPEPLAVNIDCLAKRNCDFRSTLWTGEHLQITLMSIPIGGDIGAEMHSDVDQFIRIENGTGLVRMGCSRDSLKNIRTVDSNFAVVIPAGTWHNIINTGHTPLKLYSVYAPPQHPAGTIHHTKCEAEQAENH